MNTDGHGWGGSRNVSGEGMANLLRANHTLPHCWVLLLNSIRLFSPVCKLWPLLVRSASCSGARHAFYQLPVGQLLKQLLDNVVPLNMAELSGFLVPDCIVVLQMLENYDFWARQGFMPDHDQDGRF